MRYADDQDLAGDGMTNEERKRYRALYNLRSLTEATRNLIIERRVFADRYCPAAVPALERAEANVVTAIKEMWRDLALLMGDET